MKKLILKVFMPIATILDLIIEDDFNMGFAIGILVGMALTVICWEIYEVLRAKAINKEIDQIMEELDEELDRREKEMNIRRELTAIMENN